MYSRPDTGNGWSITQTDFAGIEKKYDRHKNYNWPTQNLVVSGISASQNLYFN